MYESWSSKCGELLYLKRWTTRIELSKAMFEYIEVFYSCSRRRLRLGYVPPIEYESALNHGSAQLNEIDKNYACSRSSLHSDQGKCAER